MDTTAYILWDKIKAKGKQGTLWLNGTQSDVRAASQLANAGFIKVNYLDKYKLIYEINYEQ